MRYLLATVWVAWPCSMLFAQTSYPMITHCLPVAVQRGTSTEITVHGQMDFEGAYKVLVEGAGVHAEVRGTEKAAKKEKGRRSTASAKLKLTVESGAELGVREFRVATTLGISSIGQILVVEDPVIPEKADNNSADKAQLLSVPCVITGQIEAAEDVDFFKFHARPGQALTFEIFCARLQDKIHDLQKHADPLLTIYDAQGRELAANDDFYFADPLLAFRPPREGDYYLQVRDAKFDGDPRWVYALAVNDRPYISHLFPMAGNPGQEVTAEAIGPAAPTHVKFRAPWQPGLQSIQLSLPGGQSNPTGFLVSSLPQIIEQEPNDSPATANRIHVPCGINGRISSRVDLDYFVFAAHKGKAIRFEIKARRFGSLLRSTLDSVLDILSSTGQVLASNDDTFGKDAAVVFTPPADGDYYVRLRDLNHKGGPTAIYYLEAEWALPDFTVRCDPDKAMMGPGSSMAWYVEVTRVNGFTGPVAINVKGLPGDITASPLIIGPTLSQGVLVLTAADKAAATAVNVEVVGSAVIKQTDGKDVPIVHRSQAMEEIYAPGGGRSRFEVNMQTVCITQPSDIVKVSVSPRLLTLRPGEEAALEVVLVRRPDYDKDVSLDLVLQHLGRVFGNPLPPGVTMVENKSKTLLGKGSKGRITLRAAANAANVENVPICVLANVSINFVVKLGYASPPILLSVHK